MLQTDHPDVHYWLVTNTETSAFACSLLRYLAKHGTLTGNQIGRVQGMVDKERARHRRWMRQSAPARPADRKPGRPSKADILAAIRNVEPRP